MKLPTLIAPIIIACSLGASAEGQSNMTQLASEVGLDQCLDEPLPLDLTFHDERGKAVRLGEFFGRKPVILVFVYFRCPMLCTEVLNGLLKSSQAMQLEMGRDYEVLSISIDPRETPEMAAAKKAKYVQQYRRAGAEEGWHFLTGDEAAISQLARTAGFRYRYDAPSDQFAHASGLVLVTPEGRIARYFYGIEYPPGNLRLGLVESSAGRIGTPADQFLLLCFHYDPRTGKYGWAIANLLRLGGAVTVAGLAIFLTAMVRLERRRSAAARLAERAARGAAVPAHREGAETPVCPVSTRQEL